MINKVHHYTELDEELDVWMPTGPYWGLVSARESNYGYRKDRGEGSSYCYKDGSGFGAGESLGYYQGRGIGEGAGCWMGGCSKDGEGDG